MQFIRHANLHVKDYGLAAYLAVFCVLVPCFFRIDEYID